MMINDSMYTDAQLVVLEASSVVTGFVSLVASSVVIYTQLKNRKRRLQSMYERIILGSSIVDVIVSCAFTFLGPWAIPSEVEFVVGARGSFATCSLSGFLANFALGALVYSAFLAVFFVLRIVFEIKEDQIKKCFEPFMHSIAFGVPLASGIYALSIDAMNPIEGLPGNCWMNNYPPDCLTREEIDALIVEGASLDYDLQPDAEYLWSQLCVRGEGFETLSFFCGTTLIGLSLIVITGSMFCIVLKVYKTEKRLRVYAMSGSNFEEGARRSSSGSHLMRTRQTCVKALWYIGCFVITYFGLVSYQLLFIADVEEAETRGLYFTFAFFAKFFAPLYGFWQCIIYFRYASAECQEEVKTVISGLRSSASGILRASAVFTTPSSLFQGSAIEDLKSECCFEPPLMSDIYQGENASSIMVSNKAEIFSIFEDEEDRTDTCASMQMLEEDPEIIESIPVLQGNSDMSASLQILRQRHPDRFESLPLLELDPARSTSLPMLEGHPERFASLPILPHGCSENSASFQMLQEYRERSASLPTLPQGCPEISPSLPTSIGHPERSPSSPLLQKFAKRSTSLPILPQGHLTRSASLEMLQENAGRSASLQMLPGDPQISESTRIEEVATHDHREEFDDECSM